MTQPKIHYHGFIAATFTILLTLFSYSPNTQAGVCSSCFSAGYATSCAICEAAIGSGLGVITTALEASTAAIGASTGMPPFEATGMIGFPALTSTVNASYASHTKHVVSAIDSITKRLAKEIRTVPVTQNQIETYSHDSEFVRQGDAQNCSTIAYGQAMTQRSPSTLDEGWKWVIDGDQAPKGAALTMDEALQRIALNAENNALQAVHHEMQSIKERADAAGTPDAPVTAILDPSALVNEDKRVFSDTPDQFGMSDTERMTYLMRYLTTDNPNQSEAQLMAATSPESLRQATGDSIEDIRTGLSMAVLDNIMRTRMPATSNYGTAYLQEAMIEDEVNPDADTSDEEFVYRITKYRQRDSNIMSRILVDDEAALREMAKMEAEKLAIKYQRWRFKRDTNLVLAQILADELRQSDAK